MDPRLSRASASPPQPASLVGKDASPIQRNLPRLTALRATVSVLSTGAASNVHWIQGSGSWLNTMRGRGALVPRARCLVCA